ncbi:hypothetical protein M0804_001755 [Polistes exclamans]|nr:hypothetical protein M0804_001755 [Polistes exclamans]
MITIMVKMSMTTTTTMMMMMMMMVVIGHASTSNLPTVVAQYTRHCYKIKLGRQSKETSRRTRKFSLA